MLQKANNARGVKNLRILYINPNCSSKLKLALTNLLHCALATELNSRSKIGGVLPKERNQR